MPAHKDLTAIHRVHNWEYANASARTSATGFVSGDIGKFAKQLDDNSIWQLTAVTPVWQRVDVGGAPAAHASTHEPAGSDQMTVDAAAGTGSLRTLGTGAAQACAGNDSRLSDARTPTAHDLAGAEHNADTLSDLNSKVSDASLVALAGQLGGTAASPDVRGLRETGGPTLLTLGAIADGQVLRRSGSTVVGEGRLPRAYIYGARAAYVSATQASLGTSGEASGCRDSTDTFDIEWTGVLTAAITAAGAGGLDTGSEAANTWYALHVIGDSSGVNAPAAMLSLSDTAPTMPSGYDKFRFAGWVRNNGSSDFVKFDCFGNGNEREVVYDVPKATTRVLSGGSATTFTDVSLASYVPSTSRFARLFWEFNNVAAGDDFAVRPNGSTVGRIAGMDDRQMGDARASDQDARAIIWVATDASQIVEYEVTSAADALDLSVKGYRYCI